MANHCAFVRIRRPGQQGQKKKRKIPSTRKHRTQKKNEKRRRPPWSCSKRPQCSFLFSRSSNFPRRSTSSGGQVRHDTASAYASIDPYAAQTTGWLPTRLDAWCFLFSFSFSFGRPSCCVAACRAARVAHGWVLPLPRTTESNTSIDGVFQYVPVPVPGRNPSSRR